MERDLLQRIGGRLEFVYGPAVAASLLPRIEALIGRFEGRIPAGAAGWSQKDAMLITYGDSLPGANAPLRELHGFLRRHVGGHLSFVHLLPFYPYTSDDGFSVVDYREVRPELGRWEDIEAFSEDYRLVFDAVINHVSAASRYVKGFLEGDPAYEDFCISLPPGTDTSSVLRTRALPLLHEFPARDGVRWLWTTFSRDQVDLNFSNPEVLLEMLDLLLFYAARGASMVRLDAIAYLWKRLGTSCAHLPETHEIIKLFRDVYDAAAPHVLLLTETNVPHRENVSYFGNAGDEAQMIYNFSLAPLIVWSLHREDAGVLTEWARGIEWISPRAAYLNITATHDGIGMRPTEGILSEEERRELVQLARDRGGAMTSKRNADGSETPYELNLSYFDAINDPGRPSPVEWEVRKFLVSQAIPMAMMGIPGIYIHSLLGSRNDLEGVRRTGRARSINRHALPVADLEAELRSPGNRRRLVLDGILRLLRIRSEHSAFHPDARQEILSLHPAVFAIRRSNSGTGETVLALHNVSSVEARVPLPAGDARTGLQYLLGRETFRDAAVSLSPYQVRWLRCDPK